MEKRSIEEDFGSAIAELKKRPLSRLFLMESRYLGAVMDVTALRAMGWRPVDSRRDGKRLWRDCLWFDRRLRAPDGNCEAVLRLATSGFRVPKPGDGPDMDCVPDGEETEARLRTTEPALAYLRKTEILRETDGGMRWTEWGPDTPDWVLSPLGTAFSECQWRNWDTFSADLANQTEGSRTQLPPGVYPSPFNTAMGCLANMVSREQRRSVARIVTKRLLVRLARALAEEGYDPEGRAELESYGDGRTLEYLLVHWLRVAPPKSGEAARFLAYALERTDGLSVPYSAGGWTVLANGLKEAGFRKECVLATDRALACPDAGENTARKLFREIAGWVRERFPGGQEEAKGKLDWLLRLLQEREDILRGQDGYWTLLGLLFAANGNAPSLAVSTIGKDLPTRLDAPPQREDPRAWQALLSVESDYWVRHALAAFPAPVLSRVRGKTDLPQTVIAGMNDPDFLDAVGAWTNPSAVPAWTERAVPAAEREWARLYPPEMAPGDKGFVSATTLRVFREEGAEIELFRVLGALKPPADGEEETLCEWERHLALANPIPRVPNVVAAAWEAYPYEDNACGEIRFRAEGAEGSLAAASVWFSADRDLIYRGVPMPAYVYGFLYSMRRAGKRPPVRTDDGHEIDLWGSRFLLPHFEPDSKALYEFHAGVLSVRRVKVAGGGEILRIDLDAGTARLPCALPVYAREGLLEDGVPEPGDVVEGVVFLQIDLYPFDERAAAWMKAHPDGPGPEPDDESERRIGALVAFAKRAANGKGGFPCWTGNRAKRRKPTMTRRRPKRSTKWPWRWTCCARAWDGNLARAGKQTPTASTWRRGWAGKSTATACSRCWTTRPLRRTACRTASNRSWSASGMPDPGTGWNTKASRKTWTKTMEGRKHDGVSVFPVQGEGGSGLRFLPECHARIRTADRTVPRGWVALRRQTRSVRNHQAGGVGCRARMPSVAGGIAVSCSSAKTADGAGREKSGAGRTDTGNACPGP